MSLPSKKVPADFPFTHTGQPDKFGQSLGGDFAQVQTKFDSRGIFNQDQINLLIDALKSIVDGDSGADNIGATSLTGGTATTVQGILEELKAEIDLDDGNNVKLTGNQTVAGVKTFTSSPIVPTPTVVNDASNKGYVDATVGAVVLGQIPDGSLTDAKLSDTSGQIKDRVGVLRTDVDKLEVETDYNNKAIAEMQMFLELESKIPSKDNNKLYTDFINSFIASSGVLDLTSQNYIGTLSTGATSVVVTSSTGFVKGQEISVQDAVSYEDVIISSVVGNTINFKTALVNTYTNPRIYRSNNNQTGFGTSSTTITTYDRTTPVQVVNAAYDTSGNGGRKLVKLDNNALISVVRNGTTDFRLYKSIDSGETFSLIATITETNLDVAICTDGTNISVINTSSTVIKYRKYNDSGVQQGSTITVDTQTSLGTGISIAIDTNGHLHATWSSKNATYPNSFNIRYSKSTDGGATWGTPTQVTTQNASATDATSPTIVCLSNGNPFIVFTYNLSGAYKIYKQTFNGTSWVGGDVYYGGSYVQSNPSATVNSNGVIHVAWNGIDSTESNYYNIRYSKSTDNGATWSAMEKLTTGNPVDRKTASIAKDSSNLPYIVYDDNGTLKWIKKNGSWSSPETIATGTNPSVCDNIDIFEKPLTLFDGGTDVKFYGKWTVQTDTQTTKNVVRMNISPYINCSEIQAWITKSELTGFTVDGKVSFKALSTDDESYIDLVETVTDLGSTNEVSMTGVSTVPSKYITLKLILQRASTSDVVTFTKLVGGVA